MGNINSLVSTLDKGFTLVADNQVTGQEAAVGKTPSFDYGVAKVAPNEVANMSVGGSGDSGFALPPGDSLFGDSVGAKPLSALVSKQICSGGYQQLFALRDQQLLKFMQ